MNNNKKEHIFIYFYNSFLDSISLNQNGSRDGLLFNTLRNLVC